MKTKRASAPVASHAHDSADRLKMERLLLFTDAVYAIIMTLLALDIRVPESAPLHTTQDVLDTLSHMAPSFAAYGLSFMVVALLWNAHLRRYRYLIAVSNRAVAYNMVQLLFVGLVPFATSMLSRTNNTLVIQIYAIIMFLNVVVAWTVWQIALADPKHVMPDLTPADRREQTLRSAVVAGVFAASVPIAWWSPVGAEIFWAVQIPINLVVTRLQRRARS